LFDNTVYIFSLWVNICISPLPACGRAHRYIGLKNELIAPF